MWFRIPWGPSDRRCPKSVSSSPTHPTSSSPCAVSILHFIYFSLIISSITEGLSNTACHDILHDKCLVIEWRSDFVHKGLICRSYDANGQSDSPSPRGRGVRQVSAFRWRASSDNPWVHVPSFILLLRWSFLFALQEHATFVYVRLCDPRESADTEFVLDVS